MAFKICNQLIFLNKRIKSTCPKKEKQKKNKRKTKESPPFNFLSQIPTVASKLDDAIFLLWLVVLGIKREEKEKKKRKRKKRKREKRGKKKKYNNTLTQKRFLFPVAMMTQWKSGKKMETTGIVQTRYLAILQQFGMPPSLHLENI